MLRFAIGIMLVIHCGSTTAGVDGGTDGASCGATSILCCESTCSNDVETQSICVDGVQQCPSGSVSEADCRAQDPCQAQFCSTPTASTCRVCGDGGIDDRVCNVDAGIYECPSGSYDFKTDPDAGACK